MENKTQTVIYTCSSGWRTIYFLLPIVLSCWIDWSIPKEFSRQSLKRLVGCCVASCVRSLKPFSQPDLTPHNILQLLRLAWMLFAWNIPTPKNTRLTDAQMVESEFETSFPPLLSVSAFWFASCIVCHRISCCMDLRRGKQMDTQRHHHRNIRRWVI